MNYNGKINRYFSFPLYLMVILLCTRSLFAQEDAENAIANGDLEQAVRLLDQQYKDTNDPSILLRLCEVYSAMPEWKKAKQCLEKHQKAAKEADQKAYGTSLLKEVKERIKNKSRIPMPITPKIKVESHEPPSSQPDPVSNTPSVSKQVTPFPWHWLIVSAGVAFIGGGVVMTALAWSDRAKLTKAEKSGDVVIGITQSEANSIWSRAKTKEKISIAFYVIGGTAITSGLVWWLTCGKKADVTVVPSGSGLFLSSSWRF